MALSDAVQHHSVTDRPSAPTRSAVHTTSGTYIGRRTARPGTKEETEMNGDGGGEERRDDRGEEMMEEERR